MFAHLLDAVVQAMGDQYDPGRIWLVVNVLLPFLLLAPFFLIAWSVIGRMIRNRR